MVVAERQQSGGFLSQPRMEVYVRRQATAVDHHDWLPVDSSRLRWGGTAAVAPAAGGSGGAAAGTASLGGALFGLLAAGTAGRSGAAGLGAMQAAVAANSMRAELGLSLADSLELARKGAAIAADLGITPDNGPPRPQPAARSPPPAAIAQVAFPIPAP